MMNAMKGQYFSFDAIIATVIMVLATTTLVSYWFGVQSVVDSRNNSIEADAMRIADSLVSPGVPANWTSYSLASTYQIGLANGYTNDLNESKITKLRYYAATNYTAVGTIMRAPADYFIAIEQVDCLPAACIYNYSIGNSSAQFASETAVAHRGGAINGTAVRIRVFLGR